MEGWMEKAERYRSYARRGFEDGAYDLACSLAQQSAEFLLKALLIREVGARPLTHSLHEMVKRFAQLLGEEPPEDVARCAKSLEGHYVQARYPDARVGPYERWEAEECLRCMEALWRWTGGSR
ncbi:MAG: HEPN domain-containing protein [Thermoproteus sp.]